MWWDLFGLKIIDPQKPGLTAYYGGLLRKFINLLYQNTRNFRNNLFNHYTNL